MRRTQCLVVAALCATVALAANKHLEFCKQEKAYCQARCSQSQGFLIETSKTSSNSTHHHKNGNSNGYVCLPKKYQQCRSIDQCQTDAICSDIYGLLDEHEKICLPSKFSNSKRIEGETCLKDSMCASNLCSTKGVCHSEATVSKKLNHIKNQESSGVHRRGYGVETNTDKRKLQSISMSGTYYSAQYCSATKSYYYSYSYYCSSDLSDLYSLSSYGKITSTSDTYSTSQYCPSTQKYYYSMSYFCAASTGNSALDSAIDDAAGAFSYGVKKAGNILGAIIGGIVGGIVFIIVLIVICCYCCCKKAQASAVNGPPTQPVMQPVMQPAMQPGMQQQFYPQQQPMPGMMAQQAPQQVVINV